MSQATATGILFVLSAPSGTGKSTVARQLLEHDPGLEFSVSYTTRPRRTEERDGRDYHFVDRERFEALAAEGQFLEWAEVYGQLYGTGAAETRRALDGGRDLLLDIDVQGAGQVRSGDVPSVSVMLLPPDFGTLQSRLMKRGSESERTLTERLARARREVEDYRVFDYVVVNRDVTETVCEVESIVRAERHRAAHGSEQVEGILATFPA